MDPHAPHANAATVSEQLVFCAGCQSVTTHKMSVDKNREVLATCDCGRHLKFPLVDDPAAFKAMLESHQAANAGQVTVEQAAAETAAFDERFKKMLGIA